MRFANLLLIGVFALGTAFADSLTTVPGSYTVGMEDGGAASVEGQGDFNDMIFSLVGSGLTLNSLTGQWNAAPNLSTTGTPFWNNTSGDGAGQGVGYCIFGGGACTLPGGTPSNGGYLGAGAGGSGQVTDVLFSSGGGEVTATLLAKITAWASTDTIGWYDPNDPSGTLHTIFSGPMTTSTVITFDPSATFGLWTMGSDGSGPVYYSNTNDMAHFAFFSSLETPEPGSILLMGLGILLLGVGLATKHSRKSTGDPGQ
ncbi:MAG TPA: PEP-CTERM sorting domain-containing protein [Bryobacteraceae bacterium]|nr:PEP-CTERM sorting domain-containing protein [Bryobacteraceae bacterium]